MVKNVHLYIDVQDNIFPPKHYEFVRVLAYGCITVGFVNGICKPPAFQVSPNEGEVLKNEHGEYAVWLRERDDALASSLLQKAINTILEGK